MATTSKTEMITADEQEMEGIEESTNKEHQSDDSSDSSDEEVDAERQRNIFSLKKQVNKSP